MPSSLRWRLVGLVEVQRVGLARVQAALDAVEPRGEDDGGGEVGIARPVDRPVLDAPGAGDAQHLRAVVVAVAHVGRRPRRAARRGADHQALVGGHGRRGHRDVGLGVGLQPADELVGELGQPQAARVVGRVGLEEVLAVLPQAHVEVAAVAGEVGERLGHEGRDQPLLLGQRLDHVAEEDGAVAGHERVVELEVLLELPVGVLVVGRVVVPAQRGDVARDRRDEVEVAGQRRACRNRAARGCRARRRPRSSPSSRRRTRKYSSSAPMRNS